MEEPYITVLVTLVIHEQMNTPTTKVQSSFCLLGSSFVFLLRSSLGIIMVVDRLLSTGEEECGILERRSGDFWLVDSSLVMIQLIKHTMGGLRAGVCFVVHKIAVGKYVVTRISQGGIH